MTAGVKATEERTPVSAWALCPGWRGSPDLLAHIPRAADWALKDLGEDRPRCKVTVCVADDVERFNSPRAFRHDVTNDALRHFESIEFGVAGNGLEVSITLARRGRKHENWFKRGLLLEVTETAARIPDHKAALEQVRTLRNNVLAAVKRGVSTEESIKTGDSLAGLTAEAISRQERQSRRRWAIVSGALLVVFVGVYLAWIWRSEQGDDWVTPLYAVGGFVLGAIVPALIAVLYPSVEVSEVTKAQRTMRGVSRAAGPVIGGALALAARLLVS
jgi:hypothetical protein